MATNKRVRDLVVVLLLLVVPFFFLRTSISKPEQRRPEERAALALSAPFIWAAGAVADALSDGIGAYVYLVDVKRENEQLRRRVEELKVNSARFASIEVENARLRELLSLKERVPERSVTAQVVRKNTNEFFRVAHVAIDAGDEVVEPKMPVLAPGGVIGVIDSVEGRVASVRLIADSGSGVDVVTARTGARGYIRGEGDESNYLAKVELVNRSDELEVGDVFVTSGVGCQFPKGFPVARVVEIKKKDFGSFQTVVAEPTVDYSRLSSVLIIAEKSEGCKKGAKR